MKIFLSSVIMFTAAIIYSAEILVNFGDGFKVSTKNVDGKTAMIPESKTMGGVMLWMKNPPKYALWKMAKVKCKPLQQFQKAEFYLNTYVLPKTGIKMLALRFRDASGEVFQVNQYRPFINVKAEKATVKFVLDPSTKIQSWGGNGDKKIDWPLRFIGGACVFNPDTPGGRLYFESLEYSIPEEL